MSDFVQLTDLNGNPIWIGTSWIQAIEIPLKDEYAPTAKSRIILSGDVRSVRETVDEVRKKLR